MSGTTGGFTADDLAALKRSIAAAGNTASVAYGSGDQVRYMPIAEAKQLLTMMETDVRAATAASGTAPTRIRAFRAGIQSGY